MAQKMEPAYEICNPSFPDLDLDTQIQHGINDWLAPGPNGHPYFGQSAEEAERIRASYLQ